MGMAALALTTPRTERGVNVADLERMGIWRLRELARQTHPDHVDEAARVFAERLIDVELERRLVLRHNNPGYAPFSVTALAGEPRTEGGFMHSKELRGDFVSTPCHDMARDAMARLSPRCYAAALIRSAKDDHKACGVWARTYDDINKNIGTYLDLLGFVGTVRLKIKYENGRAIRSSALKARVELILSAKAGVI